MAWVVTLVESFAGSIGAFWLALGGLAVTAAEFWRHVRQTA
jgi:hypothetical protein